MDNNGLNKRILYFDYLRLFAALGVVIIHVAGSNWYGIDIGSGNWQIFTLINSFVRWSVPIFVMISGALLLGRDISIKELYGRRILRLLLAFVFWSLLYAIAKSSADWSITYFLAVFITGNQHLWFLIMLIGLYMFIPFLNRIIESQELTKYFLVLSFIVTFIVPVITDIVSLINNYIGAALRVDVNTSGLKAISGYVFYFVFGNYINRKDISIKNRRIIYILSILAMIFTFVATSYISVRSDEPQTKWFDYLTLNVFFQSLGVFLFFRYEVSSVKISAMIQKLVIKLSQYSFGVYLVHLLVLDWLDRFLQINTLSFNPLLSVGVITVVVFIVSYGISYVMGFIPFLNKLNMSSSQNGGSNQ